MGNDSAFNASGEDPFTCQDKEYVLSLLFLLEETQNSNTCQKLEEDARLPRVCSSQANGPNFITENINGKQ